MSFRQRISREPRFGVGARLRLLREERHISQEEVAFAAEVTQASISNYENGRNEIPLSVLLSVCDFLGVGLVDMLPIGSMHRAAVAEANGGRALTAARLASAAALSPGGTAADIYVPA